MRIRLNKTDTCFQHAYVSDKTSSATDTLNNSSHLTKLTVDADGKAVEWAAHARSPWPKSMHTPVSQCWSVQGAAVIKWLNFCSASGRLVRVVAGLASEAWCCPEGYRVLGGLSRNPRNIRNSRNIRDLFWGLGIAHPP